MVDNAVEERFLKNKYSRWYLAIIKSAVSQNRIKSKEIYYERHHVIPRALAPDLIKTKWNIVLLTPREHFICHWLLTRMTEGRDKSRMWRAFWAMTMNRDNSRHMVPARVWAKAREQMIEAARLPRKKGHVPWNKGKSIWSNEDRARISEANRNRAPLSQASIEKRAAANRGQKRTPEQIARLGSMLGKKHTEESKQQMSMSALGREPWNKGNRAVSPHAEKYISIILPLVEEGLTLAEVAERLNSENHRTSSNLPWTTHNIFRLVKLDRSQRAS